MTQKSQLSETITRATRCQLPHAHVDLKGTGSPYSITERRVPELISVLGTAGDVNHKPGGRLLLLSARLQDAVYCLCENITLSCCSDGSERPHRRHRSIHRIRQVRQCANKPTRQLQTSNFANNSHSVQSMCCEQVSRTRRPDGFTSQ